MATVQNNANHPVSLEVEDANGVVGPVSCAPGATVEVPDYLAAFRGVGVKTLVELLTGDALALVDHSAKAGKVVDEKVGHDAKALADDVGAFAASKKGK